MGLESRRRRDLQSNFIIPIRPSRLQLCNKRSSLQTRCRLGIRGRKVQGTSWIQVVVENIRAQRKRHMLYPLQAKRRSPHPVSRSKNTSLQATKNQYQMVLKPSKINLPSLASSFPNTPKSTPLESSPLPLANQCLLGTQRTLSLLLNPSTAL